MIALKGYQEKAVKESAERIGKLLEDKDSGVSPKRFLLQAPTGSGKTVMAASVVKELISWEAADFAFIFLAPNSLHIQAKESFVKYLVSENVSCITELPAGGGALRKNSILFLNWSSVNRKGNDKIKENERGEYIGKVVEKTHATGRKIIVIIDEAHNTASSKKSKELLELISPELIFEITATPASKPEINGSGDMWQVPRSQAVKSNMICEYAYFNHDIEKYEKELREELGGGAIDPNWLFVYSALQENFRFQKEIMKSGNGYHPLVGIQLPPENVVDKDSASEIKMVDDTIAFLMEQGVKRDKIAVYLSGRKENMEGITDLHSDIEVVIFKAAIAVGWDCPRLKTGALLRDTKTKAFAIQTAGRWMRQPLQESFANAYLNSAYFYTEYQLIPSLANNEVEVIVSKTSTLRPEMKDILAEVSLPSVHSIGKNESLLPMKFFNSHFSTALVKANNELMTNTAVTKPKEIINNFGMDNIAHMAGSTEGIVKTKVSDIDFIESEEIGLVNRLSTADESQAKFEKLIKDIVSPVYINNYKEISARIMYVLGKLGNLKNSDVARFVLGNKEFRLVLVKAVNNIVESYNYHFPDDLSNDSIMENITWTPHEKVEIKQNSTHSLVETPETSAYGYDILPNLIGNHGLAWATESAYLKLVNTKAYTDKFACVLKNGDNGVLNFGIPYDDVEGDKIVKRIFYPDWIGVDRDGSIFIHETKSGNHVFSPNTKAKKEAMDKYIQNLRKLGVKIYGGIVNVLDASTSNPRFLIAGENATSLNLAGEGTDWQELI